MLKQRLVGAVVLVSLAVIFIPMLLDGAPDSNNGITGSNIPLKPFVIEHNPQKPVAAQNQPLANSGKLPNVDTRQKSQSQSNAVVPVKPKSTRPQPSGKQTPKPKADPDSKIKSWVVQLGSFADKGNALKMRERLRKAKYNAFIEETRTGSGKRSFRVRVGPELDEKRAGRIQKKLLVELKITGVVLRYR